MGSPQPPSAAQYTQLQKAAALATLAAPHRIDVSGRTLRLAVTLPRQAVSLIKVAY